MERITKDKDLDPVSRLHIIYGTVIMIMSITFVVTLMTMKPSHKESIADIPPQEATEASSAQVNQPDPAGAKGSQSAPAMPKGGMPPFIKKMVEGYKTSLEKNPNDMKALTGLANMYYDSGQYPKAIGYYEKVVSLDTKNSNAQADLGTCYYYTRVFDKAVKNLSEALVNDPKNLNARYNLGIVYKSQGKFADAKKEWEIMRPLLKTDEEKKKLDTVIESLNKKAS